MYDNIIIKGMGNEIKAKTGGLRAKGNRRLVNDD